MKIFSTQGCTSTIYQDDSEPDFLVKYTIAPTWLSFLIYVGKVEGEYLGTFPAIVMHFDINPGQVVHGFRVRKYRPVTIEDGVKNFGKTLKDVAEKTFQTFDAIAPDYLVAASDYWMMNFLRGKDWEIIPYDAFEIYDDENCKILSQFLFNQETVSL